MPTASNEPLTAKPRSGYILLYTGCPVVWDYNMQMVIVLSSSESEYIYLSQSWRYLIPFMGLIKETKTFCFEVFSE